MWRSLLALLILPALSAPSPMAHATNGECSAWYSTACWAHVLKDSIDAAGDIPEGVKRHSDQMLATVYGVGQGLAAVADHAAEILKQAYQKLVETQALACKDDDLFFIEAIAVISAGIAAVELTMTGGTSAGSGAFALKALLIAQAPKLMSKLHERLCGSPFDKADPSLVTQVETAIDKIVSER
jgi:hypothetical protein